jgi:hypothetical protein
VMLRMLAGHDLSHLDQITRYVPVARRDLDPDILTRVNSLDIE